MASKIMDMTKELAEDIVLFKVGKETPAASVSLTARTLRRIAAEVEATHGDLFVNMLRTLDCQTDNYSEVYSKIVESMFEDHVINWGRIAVLFTFSGHLALYCKQHGLQEESDLVPLWLTSFVNKRLLKWIQNIGGWDSFNEHFKEKKADRGRWTDVICTMSVVVAGAAGAALVFAR
ncbi:apoptosis regulator BAX-like [Dendronephthya gigantea]|uniref:apoptosis regulator BAX-like n=1 Tax=Dendronephthya gigantea TaxID=151771 RepID=UPI00106928EE|nr:apoptosis regulator BAX-like [Dendronephthya gigantea]